MRWKVFDALVAAATRDEDDVRTARAAFSDETGRVYPDHELYGERSDAFVEWYVLDRRDAAGLTPIDRALAVAPPEDTATLHALRASHRSLYQVREVQPGTLLLEDLLGGAHFLVEERRRLPGVHAGDLFDGRLVPDADEPGRVRILRALLFHPREAGPSVLSHVQAARARREPRDATLARLLRLRLRCLSYRHVSPARIYAAPDAPA